MIPHSRPSLGPEEEAAAIRVIRSGQLSQGPEVAALEEDLCGLLDVGHAVALSSGTAALQLCLQALDLPPRAPVAMPSYVCSALLQATRHAGADPLVVDIDPDSLQISIDAVLEVPHVHLGAAIVPHMFGQVAPIRQLLDRGLPVIEDCAMALGAALDGRPAGSRGTAGVLSFYATKVICAGEGGAVVTGDRGLADSVRDQRDYDGRADGRPRYNYKMTDIQAAIARVQLGKLPSLITRRRELGEQFSAELAGTDTRLPAFREGEFPFRYVVRGSRDAEDAIRDFEKAGVAARQPVFVPIHRLLGDPDESYPITSRAHQSYVSLPLYPDLTDQEIDRVLSAAKECL